MKLNRNNSSLILLAIRAITCEFGNRSAAKTAVILGDSYALAVYNTILGALDLTKWHVVALNMRECMVADIVPLNWGEAGGVRADCAPHRDWTFNYLQETKPDLIFISDQPHEANLTFSAVYGLIVAYL